MSAPEEKRGLGYLWKQFLPLSLSDVTMAFGDPAITATLAQLPDARNNLAAVGIAKSLAVFFESPIIMILHASNALASSRAASRALLRFTVLLMILLSASLLVLCFPPIFRFVGGRLLGATPQMTEAARLVLLLLIPWPALIAWRRYFQGLLIHRGHGHAVARAGLGRLAFVVVTLGAGAWLGFPGTILAGIALVGGVFAEGVLVTFGARVSNLSIPRTPGRRALPKSLGEVWKFYWPLASSMVLVWGGRAALVAVVSRSVDGPLALAVWPATWGLVLLVANSTRMTQQVIIRNRGLVLDRLLVKFAFSVGLTASALVILLGVTPPGRAGVLAFIGYDTELYTRVLPVLFVCSIVPLLVALQNAIQGFLIEEGKTHRVNLATTCGTFVLLSAASLLVGMGFPGATAAAAAMVGALAVETILLAVSLVLI